MAALAVAVAVAVAAGLGEESGSDVVEGGPSVSKAGKLWVCLLFQGSTEPEVLPLREGYPGKR
jgi:hypothetical protein